MAKKVFVAGHNGLVGSALIRRLGQLTGIELITADRNSLDLLDQTSVNKFFSKVEVDHVYLCAAKVGGIHANNTFPAEFIYENLMIATNVIHAAHLSGVDRLLFLGSSCIYPKKVTQPVVEDSLMSGLLEPTNEPYAIAKIAGLKLCESYNRQYKSDFRCLMPSNLYGKWDNFHSESSHVIPSLIRRFHNAKSACEKEVNIWGTGVPRREFLYVDDLASACIHIMRMSKTSYKNVLGDNSFLNVGTGKDISIAELAKMVSQIVGFKGNIQFDTEKPDGTLLKRLEISKISSSGWQARISLSEGLKKTYNWYLANIDRLRK